MAGSKFALKVAPIKEIGANPFAGQYGYCAFTSLAPNGNTDGSCARWLPSPQVARVKPQSLMTKPSN
ncbi:MAG: hypothetical protein IPM82_16605 [Saprospiraceae bacterium]|nr:hypothetical protein [Saprospiraceae bacterium]